MKTIRRGLRFIWNLIVAFAVGRSDKPPAPALERPPAEPDPSEREVGASRRAESVVVAALWLAAALAIAFIVLYVVHDDTQLLGIALGLCFTCLAVAAVVAGKAVVPQEKSVEERDVLLREREVEEVDELVKEGGEGISRRRLLGAAGAAAGATVGAAIVVPAASLGPSIGSRVEDTPWYPGRRLVDTRQRPYRPSDIEVGSFYTALPQGADPDDVGSALVVVRLLESEIHLPPGRGDWAPQGILAYSKICTHAGCAVSLYRYPLYEPTSSPPALTCPCHYSTFDPARGGKVTFGPAGRPLPQLPLTIDSAGFLAAARDFPEDVGPSYSFIRRTPKGPAR